MFVVNLLPALPPHWPSGSIKGARLRGGSSVDFRWKSKKVTSLTLVPDAAAARRQLRFMQGSHEIKTITVEPGVRVQVI